MTKYKLQYKPVKNEDISDIGSALILDGKKYDIIYMTNIEKNNKWISVVDAMPQPGVTVLTYTDSNKIVIRKFCKNKFSEMTDKVIYWMALPEPPKN